MDYVLIAVLAAGIGAVLVLAYKIEQAVRALQRRFERERAARSDELVPLSSIEAAATGDAPDPNVQLVDVSRIGLSDFATDETETTIYAMAFLDEAGDGVLVTTSDAADKTDLITRQIRGGRTNEALTAWEIAAVDDAVRSTN